MLTEGVCRSWVVRCPCVLKVFPVLTETVCVVRGSAVLVLKVFPVEGPPLHRVRE